MDKDLSEFSDVLSADASIEYTTSVEFEFDGFVLRRERNHWEIQFEDEQGEQGIIVEREDFINGKLEFYIDSVPYELLLNDFDRIDKFTHENKLINH